MLIKLIGLKTFMDVCAGYSNSTFGHIFTVIGLVYIYIPFMILPIYNVLDDMPKNLVFASQDLGQNMVKTFFKIIIPYSKTAFYAGLTMVFLPAVTTVAVPQFLNNATNNATIGDIIVQEGEEGLISDIALARSSSLSLVVSIFVLALYLIIAFMPKLFKLRHRRVK
ncbi:MAG: ABC transporter permease subunit [Mycoplasmoidaceae bacterium]|nr:ABC transporter permease subunit [Mycoplasmoidaceae bacterium]